MRRHNDILHQRQHTDGEWRRDYKVITASCTSSAVLGPKVGIGTFTANSIAAGVPTQISPTCWVVLSAYCHRVQLESQRPRVRGNPQFAGRRWFIDYELNAIEMIRQMQFPQTRQIFADLIYPFA